MSLWSSRDPELGVVVVVAVVAVFLASLAQ
jgi:hypothetical protein